MIFKSFFKTQHQFRIKKMKNPEQLQIIVKDLSDHPHCEHGPTLLFSRQSNVTGRIERFFACSACRDRSECSFYRLESEHLKTTEVKVKAKDSKPFKHTFAIDEVTQLQPSERNYCHTCGVFVAPDRTAEHDGHEIQQGISGAQLARPTTFLKPLSNDKREAQYFFDEASLKCFANIFRQLKINKVICIGAPRLHEYLKNTFRTSGIQSILLDFDHRFHAFRSSQATRRDYFHYNMFNNHFFDGHAAAAEFDQFLFLADSDQCFLFTDPPFGCRTEPLAFTIQTLASRYRQVNSFHRLLPVFWIFPYFMETYVQSSMPEMEMVDYKINYTNHDTYHHGANGRKQGSPVRIFTNVPLSAIELPAKENYRHCSHCKRWVARENKHCAICQICPSKNGDTYVHCRLCGTCVKPSYKHCSECRRCTQVFNHQCKDYQRNIQCRICLNRGHTEANCKKWFAISGKNTQQVTKLKLKGMKQQQSCCFICFNIGHNEKRCKHRVSLLDESCFMGETTNLLNKSDEVEDE